MVDIGTVHNLVIAGSYACIVLGGWKDRKQTATIAAEKGNRPLG